MKKFTLVLLFVMALSSVHSYATNGERITHKNNEPPEKICRKFRVQLNGGFISISTEITVCIYNTPIQGGIGISVSRVGDPNMYGYFKASDVFKNNEDLNNVSIGQSDIVNFEGSDYFIVRGSTKISQIGNEDYVEVILEKAR